MAYQKPYEKKNSPMKLSCKPDQGDMLPGAYKREGTKLWGKLGPTNPSPSLHHAPSNACIMDWQTPDSVPRASAQHNSPV
jgi:hypothetical protein